MYLVGADYMPHRHLDFERTRAFLATRAVERAREDLRQAQVKVAEYHDERLGRDRVAHCRAILASRTRQWQLELRTLGIDYQEEQV